MKKLTLRTVVSKGAVMRYNKTIILSNGMECCLRNGTESDGQLVVDNFNLTHSETDYLLTYPDENSFNAAQESQFLKEKAESEREIEVLAIVDSVIAGTAGIEAIGTKYKVRHRAEFGISVVKKYWGLGIGKALLTSCIECAKTAGYNQLELKVVRDCSCPALSCGFLDRKLCASLSRCGISIGDHWCLYCCRAVFITVIAYRCLILVSFFAYAYFCIKRLS